MQLFSQINGLCIADATYREILLVYDFALKSVQSCLCWYLDNEFQKVDTQEDVVSGSKEEWYGLTE